jgi:hypothetical protein
MTYFEKKAQLCRITENKASYETTIDYQDMKFVLFSIQDILVFICIPCTCIIGLILNIRTVQVIKQNEKSVLKEEFYKYMSVNSKFNCAYCLILAFYPINYCNQFKSDLFCSSIGLFAQYFKIVFVAYLGETIKMCSNISYILITINRYMLIGREQSTFLERISKLEIKPDAKHWPHISI